MNRRNFFKKLAVATAGFSILPAATTYERVWKAVRQPMWIPNPDYVTAPYETLFFYVDLESVNSNHTGYYKFDSDSSMYVRAT